MLKILKWIYKLGWQHSQEKHYNTLMRIISRYSNEEETLFRSYEKNTNPKSDEEYRRKQELRVVLEDIVYQVFKPNINTTPPRNRFDV